MPLLDTAVYVIGKHAR